MGVKTATRTPRHADTQGDTHASTHASLRPRPPGARGALHRATCWASVPCPETPHRRPWAPVNASAPTVHRVRHGLPITHAVTRSSLSSMVRTVVGWKELYQCETSLSLDISYPAKVSSSAPHREQSMWGNETRETARQPDEALCPLAGLPISTQDQSDLFLQPKTPSLPLLLRCSTELVPFLFPEHQCTMCPPPSCLPLALSLSPSPNLPPNSQASLPCLL